jgi:cysteinyl-tRNA synthetase
MTAPLNYQLGGATAADYMAMDVAVLVTDPDTNGLTAAQIAQKRKTTFMGAYLSAGEAENGRWYSKTNLQPGNPSYVIDENPDWPGDFRVKFWDSAWQGNVITQAVKFAKDYDFVILDVVDVYTVDSVIAAFEDAELSGDIRDYMTDFFSYILTAIRAVNPKVQLWQNGGQDLFAKKSGDYSSGPNTRHLAMISGFTAEDQFYTQKNVPSKYPDDVKYSQIASAAGKIPFSIDYPTTAAAQKASVAAALAAGQIPFIGDAKLKTFPAINSTIVLPAKLANLLPVPAGGSATGTPPVTTPPVTTPPVTTPPASSTDIDKITLLSKITAAQSMLADAVKLLK